MYLKLLLKHQAPVLHSAAILAERFPRHVPEVIAFDAERGWMLSVDHEGRMLDYGSPERDLRNLLKT